MPNTVDWQVYLSIVQENDILNSQIQQLQQQNQNFQLIQQQHINFEINEVLTKSEVQQCLDKDIQITLLEQQLQNAYQLLEQQKIIHDDEYISQINDNNILLQTNLASVTAQFEALIEQNNSFKENLIQILSVQELVQLLYTFDMPINQVLESNVSEFQKTNLIIKDENIQATKQIQILQQKLCQIVEQNQQQESQIDLLNQKIISLTGSLQSQKQNVDLISNSKIKDQIEQTQQFSQQIQQLQFNLQSISQEKSFLQKKISSLQLEYDQHEKINSSLKQQIFKLQKSIQSNSIQFQEFQDSHVQFNKIKQLLGIDDFKLVFDIVAQQSNIIVILKQQFGISDSSLLIKTIQQKLINKEHKNICTYCEKYQLFINETLIKINYYEDLVRNLEIPKIDTLDVLLAKFPFEQIQNNRTNQKQIQDTDSFEYSDLLNLSDNGNAVLPQVSIMTNNISILAQPKAVLNNKLAEEFQKLNEALQHQKEKSMISISNAVIKSQNFSHQPEKVNIRKTPLTPEDITASRNIIQKQSTPIQKNKKSPLRARQVPLNTTATRPLSSRSFIKRQLQDAQIKTQWK
ncbi:hypothetical protein SS50377_24728 [Spironucleus salmonicida]|uniref:Uncharacterized protein n=1 Tax=Spironucleus salmonicida TaxID=348837 RepID=V6LUX8_9EUKA|nr:hypothetical protein SS50377_24728 [Spironucleus salmonicida]|eukprot:EST44609.1 Hypothetical protein SS50377_15614 [Spironucleus salmonicida]